MEKIWSTVSTLTTAYPTCHGRGSNFSLFGRASGIRLAQASGVGNNALDIFQLDGPNGVQFKNYSSSP
jgi:hypothetical protein